MTGNRIPVNIGCRFLASASRHRNGDSAESDRNLLC